MQSKLTNREALSCSKRHSPLEPDSPQKQNADSNARAHYLAIDRQTGSRFQQGRGDCCKVGEPKNVTVFNLTMLVTKLAEVRALIQKTIHTYGEIDVLLNNSGIMPIAPSSR